MFIQLTFLFALLVSIQCATYYNHLPHDGNLLYSPLSIDLGLGMLSLISSGETKDQIRNVLGNKTCSTFKEILESYSNNKKFCLSLDNLLLINDDLDIRTEIIEKLASFYNASILNKDFTNKENTLQNVNEIVNNITKDDIKETLKDLDSKSLLYLITGISLKTKWSNQFNPQDNINQTFNGTNGEKMVTFLNKVLKVNYSEIPSHVQSIGLEYEGGLKMYILLPRDFEAFMNNFTKEELKSLAQNAKEKLVNLTLPKLKLHYHYDLKPVLNSLGIYSVFSENGSFNLTEDSQNFYLKNFKHISQLEINEEGTQTSSMPSVDLSTSSIPSVDAEQFIVDKPFMFIIRDCTKHVTLFVGVIKNIE